MLKNLPLLLLLLPSFSSLSCYQCSKAVYNETGTVSYYLPLQFEELNTSCLEAPTTCSGNGSCVAGTLVGNQKFPGEASYVEIYTCLETGYDLCVVLGLDEIEEDCSYTTCSGDDCNTPPPISCPTCSLDYSDSCGLDELCPSVECSGQATECFVRFDADNCSLVRGCKEPDYSCGEDGVCQTCAPDDCTAAATEICSDTNNTCTVYTSCYSCEIDITEDGVWSNEDGLIRTVLDNQCENTTCSKAVTSCKADFDLDHDVCTVSLGCGSDGNTTQCESQLCQIMFEFVPDLFDIIWSKASDSSTDFGSRLNTCSSGGGKIALSTPVLFTFVWSMALRSWH